MMSRKRLFLGMFFLIMAAGFSGSAADEETVLIHHSLDSLEGIVSQPGLRIDRGMSAEGGGSLRVTAEKPVVIQLIVTGDIKAEKARLIYRAKLRTRKITGRVYLEMWCRFPGKGEFFSRGLHSPLSGSTEWVSREICFILKQGEDPDRIRLNLVIDGTGMVWIDDLYLLRSPLVEEAVNTEEKE